MKAYKVELLVLDFEDIGVTKETFNEDFEYVSSRVMSIQSKDIGEWEESNPLNRGDVEFYNKLFETELADQQLIKKVAEILFKEEEIDCLDIYDNLEALFINERPEVRKKHLEWQKNEELRAKQQEIIELSIRLSKAEQELKEIKSQ
jgi:predicted protein tyrosine phosphatase